MFPKKRRLGRTFFPDSARPAPKVSSPHFSASFPKAAEGYAVVVSKKTLKSAVDRHRLKRRVLDALRRQPEEARPPALILFPRAAALDLPVRDLRAELASLLLHAPSRRMKTTHKKS